MDERLRETVRGWMEEAERIDEEEDDLYGEDENPMGRMPERLADSKTREKIIEEYFERQRDPAEAERKQLEMRYKSERGRELFGIRGTTVEPVFGQIKENRECRRFMMRGIDLCRAEFLLVCTVHNLMKLRTKLRAKDMETMKMELATA